MSSKERHIESDLMLQFTSKLQEEFLRSYGRGAELNPSIAGASLGGQDTALADYFLAAQARFALIEFKHDEASIVTEKDKALRQILCTKLQADSGKYALARDVHYVAWGERVQENLGGYLGIQTTEDSMVASYPAKVCPLLGCSIKASRQKGYSSIQFIQRFLKSRVAGASASRFKKYLDFLYEIANGADESALQGFQGSVYVFVADPKDGLPGQFLKIKFFGLDHLLQLTLGRQVRNERQLAQEQASTRERAGPERSR